MSDEIRAGETLRAIVDNIEKVIVGKRPVVELCVTAMVSGGHVLIEDVPGVGKTSLASALAKTVSCGFKRIQFTPDIMPSDVTGFSVYNQKRGEFEFRPGAIMSNIVLADEINRASAKTQASLLEAMEERQVTVDAQTYRLEEPFMVIATQNPIDSFGTYPLPEAQIDRFMMKVSVGYPSPEEEVRVAMQDRGAVRELTAAVRGEDIVRLRELAGHVRVSDAAARYIVDIVTATRSNPDAMLGCSPRGTIALYAACRTWALYNGRDYVLPDDAKYLAPFVLAHRIIMKHEARLAGKSGADVVDAALHSVVVPLGGVQ
ncbi:MAG: MoxR family ATPase [Oscillospiraceae bacterium]|jgi:MoxR-like ATPase|nr:MoxR family ATPase [Oscillospiraceae bacterium]